MLNATPAENYNTWMLLFGDNYEDIKKSTHCIKENYLDCNIVDATNQDYFFKMKSVYGKDRPVNAFLARALGFGRYDCDPPAFETLNMIAVSPLLSRSNIDTHAVFSFSEIIQDVTKINGVKLKNERARKLLKRLLGNDTNYGSDDLVQNALTEREFLRADRLGTSEGYTMRC